MTEKECNICCETITKKNKEITCLHCHSSSCVECVKNYLLNTSKDPHCMSCRKEWNREFIDSIFTKTFINSMYKQHRENILVEREMSFLPVAQVELARLKEVNDTLKDLHERKKRLKQELYSIKRQINAIRLTGDTGNQVERKKFVRKCPIDNCRGFLSTKWKCGMCDKYTCSHCYEVKEDDHECDPGNVETAKLLANDTKPCPNCGILTYKVSGCFHPDTIIPTWDGDHILAKDVKIGTKLIGDDGHPREVTQLTTGVDTMYEISQKNGINYIVNSLHILSFKISGNRSINWFPSINRWKICWIDHNTMKRKTKNFIEKDEAEKFKSKLNSSDFVDITVKDYIKLHPSIKSMLLGYKSDIIYWEHKDVVIDPYVLGLWLGDGNSNGEGIAMNDIEIIEYMIIWAKKNGLEIVHQDTYFYTIRQAGKGKNKAMGDVNASIGCHGCSKQVSEYCKLLDGKYIPIKNINPTKTNPWRDCLRKYNLINNKHIPKEFLINDEDTRLKVLAGLIDTDGHVANDGRRIVINQKSKIVTDNITYLARSLGFRCRPTLQKKENIIFPGSTVPKNYDPIYHINISGKGSNIPTKVHRKKCSDIQPNVNILHTGIEYIKELEKGKYYGWKVSGNNNRFILNDFTVVHNCSQMWCLDCKTPWDWNTCKIVNENIHNPHYYEYLRQGGNTRREPGDAVCGGLPGYHTIRDNFRSKELEKCHRFIAHARAIMMPHYHVTVTPETNQDLQFKYLQKHMDKTRWGRLLQQREKKNDLKNELYNITEMFVNVSEELVRRLVEEKNIEILVELSKLRDYCNEQLHEVSKRYNGTVYKITDDWNDESYKWNVKEKKEQEPLNIPIRIIGGRYLLHDLDNGCTLIRKMPKTSEIRINSYGEVIRIRNDEYEIIEV